MLSLFFFYRSTLFNDNIVFPFFFFFFIFFFINFEKKTISLAS